MIVHVRELQCLECDQCGEQVEVRRGLLRDQHGMLLLLEAVRREHEPCEEFAVDPARAKAERELRRLIAAELEGDDVRTNKRAA